MSALEEYKRHRQENRDATVNTRHGWLVNAHFADAALAELDRLKVCGTCGHLDRTLGRRLLCELMPDAETFAAEDDRAPWSPCHLTPSRWTPYWEEA